MEGFGPHVTIDGKGCNLEKLKDMKYVFDILNNLPEKIGMHKMTLPHVVEWVDAWSGQPGISGFVMIAESHISIHTFPAEDYVFMDIFSCKSFDTEAAIEYLKEAFECRETDINIVQRGKDFPRNVKIDA